MPSDRTEHNERAIGIAGQDEETERVDIRLARFLHNTGNFGQRTEARLIVEHLQVAVDGGPVDDLFLVFTINTVDDVLRSKQVSLRPGFKQYVACEVMVRMASFAYVRHRGLVGVTERGETDW